MLFANLSDETAARVRQIAAQEGETLEDVTGELVEAGLRALYPDDFEEPPPRRRRPRVRDP